MVHQCDVKFESRWPPVGLHHPLFLRVGGAGEGWGGRWAEASLSLSHFSLECPDDAPSWRWMVKSDFLGTPHPTLSRLMDCKTLLGLR